MTGSTAAGEVWVRTPTAMVGSSKAPERTAEVVTPDKFVRTGMPVT